MFCIFAHWRISSCEQQLKFLRPYKSLRLENVTNCFVETLLKMKIVEVLKAFVNSIFPGRSATSLTQLLKLFVRQEMSALMIWIHNPLSRLQQMMQKIFKHRIAFYLWWKRVHTRQHCGAHRKKCHSEEFCLSQRFQFNDFSRSFSCRRTHVTINLSHIYCKA